MEKSCWKRPDDRTPGAPCVPCCRLQARFFSLLKREKRGTQAELQYSDTKIGEKDQKGQKLLLYFYYTFYTVFVDWAVFEAIYLKFDKDSTLVMSYDNWLLDGAWLAI